MSDMQRCNWLLLRGLGREVRHWENFPELLAEHTGHSQVFCLDLAGAGTQYQADVPNSIADFTLDLRRRWLRLREEHDGPWRLLTISLGSMIGLEWCARFPQDVLSHVLINSSASNLSGPFQRLRPRNYPRLVRAMTSGDSYNRERLILKMTTAFHRNDQALAKRWASYADEYPMSRKALARQLWAATRYRVPQGVETPMYVLASSRDRFVDVECSVAVAKHFHAPIVFHPSAGHDLALDDGPWVCEQVNKLAA